MSSCLPAAKGRSGPPSRRSQQIGEMPGQWRRAGKNLHLRGGDCRLHAFHQILLASGADAAANQLMFLHLDLATERVTDVPPSGWQPSARSLGSTSPPPPEAAGRGITLRRPR